MKKRLNIKFMTIAAIAIVVTACCSILLFFDILVNQIYDDLKANAHVISMMNPEKLSSEIDYDLEDDGLRITLIEVDGTVRYDSREDEKVMENHKERPEIQQAFLNGEGRKMRKSTTSVKHMFYYAMRMDNGEVLRIGKESSSIYHFAGTMAGMIFILTVGVFLLCAWFSRRMTKGLIAPVEKLADNIVLVDEQEVYEEMRPFVTTIKQQHMDILNHVKMRQEFTANVSHELKTPLTAISGYAELIGSGMTNEKDTRHFADEIHQNAERLQRLINDIIKLSELDDEHLKLEFETVDLYELGKNCIAQMELQAQKNGVSLVLTGESETVYGNKTLLEELVYNLCSNAIRYNKKGGRVTISVANENGKAVFCVEDTGIGIPKDQQERIFERFYRVDKSRSKSTGGTGLGLAIVKHIAAQHDAQICLESEEGKGTKIKVVF